MTCDHKFVDSNVCLKCGVSIGELRAADAAERDAYELRSAIEERGEELRPATDADWEAFANKTFGPRERLVAEIAVMSFAKRSPVADVFAAGEAFVAAMEAEPDKPAQCPCCTKQVTLCTKHYQLHEPGAKCVVCKSESEPVTEAGS